MGGFARLTSARRTTPPPQPRKEAQLFPNAHLNGEEEELEQHYLMAKSGDTRHICSLTANAARGNRLARAALQAIIEEQGYQPMLTALEDALTANTPPYQRENIAQAQDYLIAAASEDITQACET